MRDRLFAVDFGIGWIACPGGNAFTFDTLSPNGWLRIAYSLSWGWLGRTGDRLGILLYTIDLRLDVVLFEAWGIFD